MRVNELYNHVSQLGFEDSLEDNGRFYYAANRALLQVSAIRPATGAFIINHKPLKNLVEEDTFSLIERAEDLCFEAMNPKAYYAECDGNGVLYVERQEECGTWKIIEAVELSSSGTFVAYRGFVREDGAFVAGPIRLRFAGEYLYSVRNVALFEHIHSANAEDIKAYEPWSRYNMRDLAPRFLELVSPPVVESQDRTMLNQKYDVVGDSVLLPYEAKGCFAVHYKMRPTPIDEDQDPKENTAVIDLDEELCSLLPNLVASYVWLEDEAAMAQYYYNLYQQMAADVERRARNSAPVRIVNRSGW